MIDPELALRIASEDPLIAVDTETSGLGPDAFVVGWVITNEEHSVYVPVRHDGGGNIPDGERFEKELNIAFEDRTRLGYHSVGHNLAFDLKLARRHGVKIGGTLEDTMINEGLIDDNAYGYGLDDCAGRHSVTAKKGAELYRHLADRFGGVPDRKQMANYWRLPGDDQLGVDYATGDGVSTLALRDAQQRHLDEQGLRRVWQLECDLIPYVDKTISVGFRVDQEYAAKVLEDIEKDVKDAYAQFPKGFNVRSPKDLEAYFRAAGVTDFAQTAQGKPSFREAWLEGNEAGRAILVARRLEKARDSFITPILERGERVFCTLNQSKSDDYGTVTGRFSCSDPNLQAFPKRNVEVGKRVRRLFIPDDGMDLYEADFQQQEPHLFAHYSEDPALIAGYLADPPLSLHDIVKEMLGLDRDTAKRLGMGMLTGMSIKGLAERMGIEYPVAKGYYHGFFKGFPQVKDFQDAAKNNAICNGYVRSIMGRRRRYPNSHYAYQAISGVIQGSGADHMKLSFLRAHQYMDSLPAGSGNILLTIHDSTVWQMAKDREKEAKELNKVLESTAKELELVVPIPTDFHKGSNWAEASYGDK